MRLCPDFHHLSLWFVVVVFDRTLSLVFLRSCGADDPTRRDGYQPQQWNGCLAGQVRNERMVLATLFGEPRLVKIPRVVHVKATFQQGCMGSIVRVPQGMFAVGRRRLRRVLESMCWRATPSGPVRKVLRELRDKLKKMENARKEQLLEQEEDVKPDENGRMGGCAKRSFFKTESSEGLPSRSRAFQLRRMWRSLSSRFCSRTWSNNVDQITEVRPRYRANSKLLQRTRDQFVDLAETQIMDHVDLNMPKISIQESVEAAENVLQERIPERMCEQIGMIDVPKVSSQESVEVVKKIVLREQIF